MKSSVIKNYFVHDMTLMQLCIMYDCTNKTIPHLENKAPSTEQEHRTAQKARITICPALSKKILWSLSVQSGPVIWFLCEELILYF